MKEAVKEEKDKIRRQIKVLKGSLTEEEKKQKSKAVFDELEQLPEFKAANVIMAYWALPDEVQTRLFVLRWYKEKRIILPIVKGDVLELGEFVGENDLARGSSFGIYEPKPVNILPADIDLIIVPGVAFDTQNNRLGRGKGYYDKLLAQTAAYKIGICYRFQLVNHIPTDEFDIPVNRVISA